jgi:hypothetical protein
MYVKDRYRLIIIHKKNLLFKNNPEKEKENQKKKFEKLIK